MNPAGKRILLLFLLVGGLGYCLPGHGQEVVLDYRYSGAASSIRVEALFSESLRSGMRPYRVTIRNGSGRDLTWNLRFDLNNTGSNDFRYVTNHRIRVEDGSEGVQEVLVHSPPVMNQRYASYRSVHVTATVPGLRPVNRHDSEAVDFSWPSIGMSQRLAQRNLTRLEAKKKSGRSSNDHFASVFTDLPSDWRGLTALDLLMIDDATWKQLSRQQRAAVMTWVRFGGRVDFFVESGGEVPGTPKSHGLEEADRFSPTDNEADYSLGFIKLRTWDGREIPDSLVDEYRKADRFEEMIDSEFDQGWGLIAEFGQKAFNPFLVFVLLIIFAVLVGPVNLFYFARAGQRQRLFVTTPVISLVASLVIILIILIQDGIGGAGRRIALAEVLSTPEQRQLQLTQHQISRTGVMFQSGFDSDEPLVISPVNLPPSRWNPLSGNGNRSSDYQFTAERFGGDFFRSRSEQGFHLRTARPTRSRVELQSPEQKGAVPELFSSLEFGVTDFFYLDRNGIVWKGAGGGRIGPGEKIELAKSNLTELTEWLEEQSETLAKTDRDRVRLMTGQWGRYFALADRPGDLMVDTHEAIRWKHDAAIVTGKTVTP